MRNKNLLVQVTSIESLNDNQFVFRIYQFARHDFCQAEQENDQLNSPHTFVRHINF